MRFADAADGPLSDAPKGGGEPERSGYFSVKQRVFGPMRRTTPQSRHGFRKSSAGLRSRPLPASGSVPPFLLLPHPAQLLSHGPVKGRLAALAHIIRTFPYLPAWGEFEQPFYSRYAYALLMDHGPDTADPDEVVVGKEPAPAVDLRPHQPLGLIDTQGAGMNVKNPGRHSDGIDGSFRPDRSHFLFLSASHFLYSHSSSSCFPRRRAGPGKKAGNRGRDRPGFPARQAEPRRQ